MSWVSDGKFGEMSELNDWGEFGELVKFCELGEFDELSEWWLVWWVE